jgi:hypothetical protein
MAVLVPCPSCARHIAISEASCPFCASALPSDLESRAIPGTSRRLSRAAMFTFATTVTVLGAVASCDNGSDDSAYGCPATDENCVSPDGSIGNLYGGPTFDGSVQDDGGISTHYGLPGDATVDDSGDAGEDAD